jgi:hypothetical protein
VQVTTPGQRLVVREQPLGDVREREVRDRGPADRNRSAPVFHQLSLDLVEQADGGGVGDDRALGRAVVPDV